MDIPSKIEEFVASEGGIVIFYNPTRKRKIFSSLSVFYNFMLNELDECDRTTKFSLGQFNFISGNLSKIDDVIKKYTVLENDDNLSDRVKQLLNELSIFFQNTAFVYSQSKLGQFLKTIPEPDIRDLVFEQIFSNGEARSLITQSQYRAYYYAAVLLSLEDDTITINNQNANDYFSPLISEISKLLPKFEEDSNKLLEEKIEKFNEVVANHDAAISTMANFHENNLINIEKKYDALMKLKAPAKLWDKKQDDYNKRGWLWSGISASIVLLTICLIIFIGANMPNFVYDSNTGALIIVEAAKNGIINVGGFIRWLLFFGVAVSLLAYFLRMTVKLALSSFHMARDAEEKSALAQLYLSLISDKNFDPDKDKEIQSIIFNALFARVETGLLKGDSSPTIPLSASDLLKGNRL